MLPKHLKKGDTIGIIAPSSPISEEKRKDMNHSKELIEKAGFKIKFSKNCFSNDLGYSATAKKKAEDINEMFKDHKIKAIFCATGGANANMTFEFLDYNLIKENPKIFCGFSDSTSLLNIIYQKTGLVTFHGPTFKALTSWQTDYAYKEVMDKFLERKTRLARSGDEFVTIKKGKETGELVGGNLSIISKLVAGKYAIDFKGKILFMEELGYESDPEMVSGNLYYLKQNGVFHQIKGIWVGNYEHESNIPIEKILLDVLEEECNFPIIKSNNFGHTDRKNIIPIGTKAKIDTNEIEKIVLLEDCVE